MPQTLTTAEIALRLLFAVAAGFVIGFNEVPMSTPPVCAPPCSSASRPRWR